MAKFFLKLGTINKKLLLPSIASILYMIMDIIEYYSDMSELHFSFDLYTRGISYTALILIPLIQKYYNKRKTENTEKFQCNKKVFLHFFFLYLEYIIYFALYSYIVILKSDDIKNTEDFRLSHYYGLCSEEALEIIFIVIVSKFLLKTKLYIHHYIGLAIFIIFSLCIDIPFNSSLFKPGSFFLFIYCLYILTDSIFITYEKYMMDKLYYSPYVIVFSIGLLYLFAGTLFTIIVSAKGGLFYDGNKYKYPTLVDYFKEIDYKEVIVHIIYLICFRFVLNILKILTIYYLSQNHIYAAYILIKEFDLILNGKKPNYKYVSILLFALEFIGLLIFLEIIELNILNLNKNTKRNIDYRRKQEERRLSKDNEKLIEDYDHLEKYDKIELSYEYLNEIKDENDNYLE